MKRRIEAKIENKNIRIAFVPYADKAALGYVRFADKDDNYLFALDERTRIETLKRLRRALDSFIRRSQK